MMKRGGSRLRDRDWTRIGGLWEEKLYVIGGRRCGMEGPEVDTDVGRADLWTTEPHCMHYRGKSVGGGGGRQFSLALC